MHIPCRFFLSCLGAPSLLFAMPLWAEQEPDVSPQIRIVADGVKLTLVGEHPDVVTPTGIDIDDSGKLWVAVSHTHFRPEGYDGPEQDEVIVLSGKPGNIERRVFYNRTDATMDLELGGDGWVYLAERDRILRVRDTDGDGVGDVEQDIAVLETEADYPHNGLSGMAWHPSGDLVFALGENYWKPWTLTGAGGDQVRGTGEGGIFRCRADGTGMRRIAKGFWNPFGVCVRSDGTMFASENDPGSRPPCRLLHIVEGGDYGYQRRYGNASIHPFVCWNGELRGTLPMMHSLGEAPCGIAPLANGLIVPSWTDHRIDFYPLRAKGASFQTERVTLVEGGRQFRPTCIVQAAPTVFYLTDWVFGSYKLHGYGRVWKLEVTSEADWMGPMKIAGANEAAKLAAELRDMQNTAGESPKFDPSNQFLFQTAQSDDPFLASAAIDALARRADQFTAASAAKLSSADRITLLLAVRRASLTDTDWIDHFLQDSEEEIRFETLRWIADAQLEAYRDQIQPILDDSAISYRLFEAALATWNTLAKTPEAGVADPAMLLRRITDETATPRSRAFAMRLVDPRHGKLNARVWDQLLASDDELLKLEATRTLAGRGNPDAESRLIKLATDPSAARMTRADAIVGISAVSKQGKSALLKLAEGDDRVLREEALRSIRFATLDRAARQRLDEISNRYPDSQDLVAAALDPESLKSNRPAVTETEAWRELLDALPGDGDIEAGRRIFHHARVGLCANCHRHRGRGRVVGPDLSATSNAGDPNRVLKALLEPSRDVDPQYYPWSLLTEDGDSFTGILLRDGGGGTEFFRDNQGRERKFLTKDIVARKPLMTSVMPDGLIELMTIREIRDVLAFLDHPDKSQRR